MPLIVLGDDLLVAVVWDWPVKQQVNKKVMKRVKPKILCVEVLISFDLRVERGSDKSTLLFQVRLMIHHIHFFPVVFR